MKKKILEMLQLIISKLDNLPENDIEIETEATGKTNDTAALSASETNSEVTTLDKVKEVEISKENQDKIELILSKIMEMLDKKVKEPEKETIERIKA